jgi:DNA processing protein
MSGRDPTGAPGLPHEAYLAALATLDRMGPATMRRLLTLGTPEAVWERVRAGPLPRALVDALPRPSVAASAGWSRAARGTDPAGLWDQVAGLGAGAVSIGSPGYPSALVQDLDPPVLLFHLGDPDVLVAPRVAVIGTRRATGYGLRAARELGAALSAAGVCVVSGLALGIDAAAHHGAVDAGGAPPAAVIGSGLDRPGPVRNAGLAAAIARRGVILTEAPPGVTALPWRFPVRNRILAGLAQAVVVVESAATGGSMLTVHEAQRRDVPVLAVPGPVDSPASEGTNQLLAEGAGVCTGPRDVLELLSLTVAPAAGPVDAEAGDPRPDPQGDASRVLDELGWRPSTVEQLALRTGLGLGPLASAIGALEQDGWALQRGGFVERIARPPVRGSDRSDAYRRSPAGPSVP